MDLLYAVLEGITFAIRDCLEKIGLPRTVYLSGGGAKSSVWAQLVSDVLGTEVLVGESSELAAKGAAISAAIMADMLKDKDEIRKRFLNIKARYVPDMEKHKKYHEIYIMYKKMQDAVRPFWTWRKKLL